MPRFFDATPHATGNTSPRVTASLSACATSSARAPGRRDSAPSVPRRSRRRRRAASRGTRRPAPASRRESRSGRSRAALADPCTPACAAGRRCPVSSCSAPIGRWTATHFSDSCARSASSARKKSARSRSSMFTKTTRERPPSSARCQCRDVCTSTPMTALTTKSAPSTTRSAAIASPWKPASPGVSMRLILRPCHSRWQIDAESDIWRRCSSSSQSLTVEPASTVPEPVRRARLEQHRLDERGLARPAVPDDGDVADLPRLVLACAGTTSWRRCVRRRMLSPPGVV